MAPPPAADHTLTTRRPGRDPERPSAARDNAALLRDADRSFKSGDLSSALVLARRAACEQLPPIRLQPGEEASIPDQAVFDDFGIARAELARR